MILLKHIAIFFLFPIVSFAQVTDSLKPERSLFITSFSNALIYKKLQPSLFLTNIPADIAGLARQSFKKENLRRLCLIAGSTALLYIADQSITNTLQDKLEDNNITALERFSPLIKVNLGGKPTNIGKVPKNINTAFYNLGQGSSAMFLAAGFYLMGKIKKNNRALQTAGELTEAFMALGFGTQVIKYATGRENPSDITASRGRWRPFPSWKKFQNNKTKYDAFPSGHLATFISAVTVIGENYPEKKWIKPLGYSIAGLCGLAMINNGVHWASDFPLGFALGYGFGKYVSKKHRMQIAL